MSSSKFNNILIVGCGVMGGTYLKSLAEDNVQLYVIETDVETRNKIKNDYSNIIFITLDDIRILHEIDLVILTLYPTEVNDYMVVLNDKLRKDCLLIEISGIKEKLAKQLTNTIINYDYLLVHPMAGNENGGYEYSRKGIFLNANHIIIDDQKQCRASNFAKYFNFINDLGFNQPILMSSLEHDKAVTYTSQLSHVIASALLNSTDYQDYTRQTIGDSFRDLTRIAKMNVEMWSSLFVDNESNLSNSIDNLIEQLEDIRNSLSDKELLKSRLLNSREKRNEFENDR